MTPSPLPPGIPPDPGLPGARGLLGAGGRAAVAGFLEERAWSAEEVRPVQVLYRPGRSCLVRYRALAEDGRGARRVFTLCAETRYRDRALPDAPDGAEEAAGLPDSVGARDGYRMWAFPYDPALPGLTRAARGEHLREGLEAVGPRPSAVHSEVLRYRPRRRAVFRYRALHRGRGWHRAFGKVMPPGDVRRALRIGRTVRRSRRLPMALPAGIVGDDTVLFDEMPGRSLREVLTRNGSLPRPERVSALLDELPRAIGSADIPPAPEPAARAGSTAALIERLVPEAGPSALRVAEAVSDRIRPLPARVVHGDLYEAQVLVEEDFSLGLVDLDDLAMGDPAVDAGSFCAHLVALAMSVPAARPRLLAYRSLVRKAFMDRLGLTSDQLALREGLRMLLLAPGPFRTLHPAWPAEVRHRVDLAVRLAEVTEA
jgi:Phosphotransferase enzyme family